VPSLHESIAERLNGYGSRYTSSRRRLVETLVAAGRPLAADEVMAAAPSIPRGSVYRNLGVLEECRVVKAIAGHDEFARYELDEAFIGHHHHLVCTSCGSLIDAAFPAPFEARLDAAIATVASDHAFTPIAHRVDIEGTCEDCRRAAATRVARR
jgi:Fur family ferric uptake transcriptional regulator